MAKNDVPNLKDVQRIPEELLPVVQWWQDHGIKTSSIVAVVLLVVAGGVFWHSQRAKVQNDAAFTLATAEQVEDYETIAKTSTDAAKLAQLDMARALYNAGDATAALEAYATAKKNLAGTSLEDIAILGHVCALEALARYDEALEELAPLEGKCVEEKGQPFYFLTSEVLLAKARVLCQKGDKAAAKAALEPLLSAVEPSALAKYKPQAERTEKMIDAYVKPAAVTLPAIPAATLVAPVTADK